MTELDDGVKPTWCDNPVAVLVSGGPDSAVLVGELAPQCPRVVPIYVRFGMIWEGAEEKALRRFLVGLHGRPVEGLQTFDLPIKAVYGAHWSLSGENVPDAASPDAAVFLPGRNLLLLAQASIWCHLHDIAVIAMGLLKGNPFPDSNDAFFESYEAAFNTAVGGRLRVVRPYRQLTKEDVLRRGRNMPLMDTWSCMRPVETLQCGQCNKCGERKKSLCSGGNDRSHGIRLYQEISWRTTLTFAQNWR